MKIERLCVDNLKDGIFCAIEKTGGNEMYDQLGAWLEGGQLRGQIVRDHETVAGFILYYPIEHAPLDVDGEGLYVVQCIFVKPEYQNKGFGRALIESALADARDEGASGLAVEGFKPQGSGAFDYMPGTFFESMGMSAGESRGQSTLYYMSLKERASRPQYMDPKFTPPVDNLKVRVDVLDCRNCYVGITNREVVKSVVDESDNVDLVIHDQNSRETVVDKGMSSGIFIDGKLTFFRGPVSEEDIWNAIKIANQAYKEATDR